MERLGIAKVCMIALAVALWEASFYKTRKNMKVQRRRGYRKGLHQVTTLTGQK